MSPGAHGQLIESLLTYADSSFSNISTVAANARQLNNHHMFKTSARCTTRCMRLKQLRNQLAITLGNS